MEWQENPQLADNLLAMIADDLKEDKPLPHVTELIYCLTRSYNDRFNYIPLSPKEVTLFSIGVNLNDTFLRKQRQEVHGVHEGIHYSMDFLMADDRIGELKSTRISPSKNPQDFPTTWNRQILSYMETQGAVEAVFAIIHLIPAVFKTWEVTATHEEVTGNWIWMLSRRAVYMDFVERQVLPPPFEHNEDWECKNCRYKLGCDAEMARLREEAAQQAEAASIRHQDSEGDRLS